MENLILIGTIVFLHLLATISPGPEFLMVVKNSLTYSRKSGIYTAFGESVGILVHVAYCIAGIATIISKSILLFNFLKFLGAGCLVFIGVKSIMTRSKQIEISEDKQSKSISNLQAFKLGFLTNVLNPKATLFFLSLFTLVIKPDISSHVIVISTLLMMINSIVWYSLIAIFFTHDRIRKLYGKTQNFFNKTFGALLILLGLKVAFTQK